MCRASQGDRLKEEHDVLVFLCLLWWCCFSLPDLESVREVG